MENARYTGRKPMKNQAVKTFNLNQSRPQVLLVGNGMTYGTGLPWYQLIQQVVRNGVDIHPYEKTNQKGEVTGFHVPNTIVTLATSETDDAKRHQKYGNVFQKTNYAPNEWIKKLTALPFDAILTTNYTYELETALYPKYPALTQKSKAYYAFQTGKEDDAKYLIHTFNRIGKNNPDIWHIHGELRRPSSIILSHDEYARLVCGILNYNTKRGNDYEKEREALKFESWIDYFVMGDVYTLGLGFDFSDFDLWWLLGRRMREKTQCGKFIFYEPEKAANYYKQLALADAGAEVNTCGVTINTDDDYSKFYNLAIEDIREQITK